MKTILLVAMPVLMFLSCSGQSKGRVTGNEMQGVTIGDTVSELDKAIWIVFQARDNSYWFGSDGQGVYRYDGKTLIHFSTKDRLANDQVRGIQEDKSGNVFINTLAGISKFDGQKFTTLPVIESEEWKSAPGDLWFTCNQDENGPYRYDGKSLYHLKFPKHHLEDEFYKNIPNPPYNPYQVYSIYKDSKGSLWFGTSTFGVYRYDGTSLSWLYEKHLTHIGENGSFGIRSIIEDKDGKFWFCNTRYRYNILPDKIPEIWGVPINYRREEGIEGLQSPTGDDFIYFQSVVEDNKRNLWMLTHRMGVWQYDGENTAHYSVKDDSGAVRLVSIYKDNRGGLWLGTQEAGVYKFNGKTFEPFKP